MSDAREKAWGAHLRTKRNHRQARRSSFDAGWDAAKAETGTEVAIARMVLRRVLQIASIKNHPEPDLFVGQIHGVAWEFGALDENGSLDGYVSGLSRAAEIVRAEARAPRKGREPKMSIQEHDIIVNAALAKAASAIEAEKGTRK
ncbi:hypothetical protein [Cryobacterium sp. BB736]|uniref:hypothetical protein n=1 Tax=Cryobacterium sp. BB736 TaxID=2746963 RepID=UPI0018750954|nr:hypothetical protein [Cryobacterium sp. BB736]